MSGDRCASCGQDYPEGTLYDVETISPPGETGPWFLAVCGPWLDDFEYRENPWRDGEGPA